MHEPRCRLAFVAEVYPMQPIGLLSGGELQDPEPQVCALMVINPAGLFFNDSPQDEYDLGGGTWHFPRVACRWRFDDR